MNKYQKALTNLHNRAMSGGDRKGKIVKQTKTLQELVDKVTPKKVSYGKVGIVIIDIFIRGDIGGYICPTCGCHLEDEYKYIYTYCPYCGQALDWSEE